jgi:hypothetical protein
VQNGVLASDAYLSIFVDEPDQGPPQPPKPGLLTVLINGHAATYKPVPLPDVLYGSYACVPITTKYLKFAAFDPGGGLPIAADNEISISIVSAGGQQTRCEGVSITIRALYPVIMVHGMNADKTWFTTNGFTTPFDLAKIPYRIATDPPAISLHPGSITQTGETLRRVVPALAKQFGVSKVHIVAHSKGGLWARYLIGPHGPYSSDLTKQPSLQILEYCPSSRLTRLTKNHSTVGDTCVAAGGSGCTTGGGVLGAIQNIQPVR